MVRVTVVIPNWDGEDFLPACLGAIQQQTYQKFDVIVVDNGSGDQSLELIQHAFPRARLLRFGKNRGFAAAVNAGIRAASTAIYIALLNNDTHPTRDWLSSLVRVLDQNPRIAAIAGKMVTMDNPRIIDNAGDTINIVGQADAIGRGVYDRGQYEKMREIFSVCAGGALYRRSVFDRIGFFDERFFSYFEDVDFGFRMRIVGLRAWYTPGAVLLHRRGSTAQRLHSRKEFLHFRNTWMLVIKNFPLKLFFRRRRWWKMPLVFARTVQYFWMRGMWKESFIVMVSLMRHLPCVCRERITCRKKRQVSIAAIEQWMEEKPVRLPWQKKRV